MKKEEIFSDCNLAQNQIQCLSISVISNEIQMEMTNKIKLKVNIERNQTQDASGSEMSIISEEFQKQQAREPKESTNSGKLRNQSVTEPMESSNYEKFRNQMPIDPEASVISEVFQMQRAVGSDSLSKRNGTAGDIINSVDQVINSRQDICSSEVSPKRVKQVLASIIVSLTHLGLGVIFGFSGVTLPQFTQPESDDIFLDTQNAALFGTFAIIGGFFGGIFAAPVVTWIGLRMTMLMSLPITLAFWLLLAFSPNVISLLVARMGLGVMAALILTSSNAYVLEIAYKDLRGILFGALHLAKNFGYLFIFTVGSSSLTWRQLAIISGVVTVGIPFAGLLFFPESPRWLVTKGRIERANKSLVYFRGEEYDSQCELNAIIEQVETARKQSSSQCRQLFLKSNLKLLLTLFMMTIFTSFNGSFVITTYTVPIFQSSGSNVDPYMSTILVGCCRIIGTLIFTVAVDRLGRKYFLIFCHVMMSICLALFGAYIYLEGTDWVMNNLGWLPLTSVLGYKIFLGTGQPIVFTLQGELLPTNIRPTGLSILNCTLYFVAALSTFFFPIMNENIGESGSFWTFSISCFLVAMVTCIAVPETSGLSLEEITAKNAAVDV